MKKYFACFVSILALFIISGCGPTAPYKIVPIEGVATWNGKPIPKEFTLKFRPGDGTTESTGFIKENGKFVTIHTVDFDGVPTGKVTVRVIWNGGDGTTPPGEYKPLLEKYGFQSAGLPLEITKKDLNMKLEF